MKKARWIIIIVLVLLLGVGAAIGVSILRSPHYALWQVSNDIKEYGIEGLRPHLTDEAQEKVDSITAIAENELVGAILSIFGDGDYMGVLKSNIKEIEWSLEDVLKGGDTADVRVGFDYKDKLTGTIDINMVRVDGEWKISGVGNPSFDKVDFGK